MQLRLIIALPFALFFLTGCLQFKHQEDPSLFYILQNFEQLKIAEKQSTQLKEDVQDDQANQMHAEHSEFDENNMTQSTEKEVNERIANAFKDTQGFLADSKATLTQTSIQDSPLKGILNQELARSSLSIGVAPVELPSYMRSPQIVIQRNNEIFFSEYHRWAGPIVNLVTDTLIQNLSIFLKTEQIKVIPALRKSHHDYSLYVQLDKFIPRYSESLNKDELILNARWDILDHSTLMMASNHAYLKKIIDTDTRDYAALVYSMSEVLSELSIIIARDLCRLAESKTQIKESQVTDK